MSMEDYCKRVFYSRSFKVLENHNNKLLYSIPEKNNSINTFECKLILRVNISMLYNNYLLY